MPLPVSWRNVATIALVCGGIGLGLVIAAIMRGAPEEPGSRRSTPDPARTSVRDSGAGSEAAVPATPSPTTALQEPVAPSDPGTGVKPGVVGRAEPVAPERTRRAVRTGRAIRGVQYTFLWSDDALEPPIGPPDPEQVARLARMPEEVRSKVAAADDAVVHAERRRLEVEAQVGGSPLREAVFQLAAVDSLGSGFVVWPGRDLPIPASPEASLDHTLGGGAWSSEAVQRVRHFEAEQATRRFELVSRAIEVARQRSSESALKAAALWVSQGRALYVESADAQELSLIAEDWRRTREKYMDRIRRLLR